MRYAVHFICIVFLLVANLGLFGLLPIWGQIPNLLFLFVLCSALAKKEFDFLFVAFLCGLFLDFYSPAFFGGHTLALLLIALVTYLFSNYIFVIELNFKNLALATIFSWLGLNLIVWLWGLAALKFNLNPSYVSLKIFMSNFLPGLIYNLLLLYPMYLFYDFLRHSLDNYEARSRGVIK